MNKKIICFGLTTIHIETDDDNKIKLLREFIDETLSNEGERVIMTSYSRLIEPCPICGTTELLCGHPKECSSDMAKDCDHCGDQFKEDDLSSFQGEKLCDGCKEDAEDEFHEEICQDCHGSGEGYSDGSTCQKCRGKGVLR